MSDSPNGAEPIAGLLSVVIPIGEINEWLMESVASVLAQTDVDLEVIAVFNNGAAVPDQWKPGADPRVRVVYSPESLGSGGAGQAGIDVARGEFFVRLDADDRMLPGRLKEQLEWFQGHPDAVLVSSQVDWIDGTGARTGRFDLPTGADVRSALLRLNVCPHSSWMVRMSIVHEVGGYDPAQYQMDDYDLLLRIATRGSVAVLPRVLTEYRLHDGQMSRAVEPWGHYVGVIAERRRALGRVIGASKAEIARARLWWEWQQWLMYAGRRIRG